MLTIFDGFFARALAAGIGVALVAGPLGCFVVWRRLSYFGDALSHAALLGVAAALLFEIDISMPVFVVAILVAAILNWLQRSGLWPADSLLGLLSHAMLALGLVSIALMNEIRVDLHAYLFGDLLAVSRSDLVTIFAGAILVLGVLVAIWQPLFALTVNEELAGAEGVAVERTKFIFTVLVAAVIAISIKIVGAILITAMMIIPATTARRLASSPEKMAFVAIIIGIISVLAGLYASLQWDTPSGPGIIVASIVLFVCSLAVRIR